MALEDIEKLKEKVKKDPNSKLFVPLAEEYRKTGMLDEAISVLMTGITSQPGYASARVSLGKIYLEKKMAPAAKEEFEKVISAIPDNLLAHKKLAEIYRDSGEKERAIGEYRVVLKLNPLDDDAVSNLETLQRGHMQEESITATESAPEEFTVQGNEAVALQRVNPPHKRRVKKQSRQKKLKFSLRKSLYSLRMEMSLRHSRGLWQGKANQLRLRRLERALSRKMFLVRRLFQMKIWKRRKRK